MTLTAAELRVLRAYLANGTVKGAAHELGRSEQTVKNRLSEMHNRTGLTTAQLCYLGAREGWLQVAI